MILGGSPYPVVPLENLFDLLKSGYRMGKPLGCPRREHVIVAELVSFSFPKWTRNGFIGVFLCRRTWYFVLKKLASNPTMAFFKNALFLNNQPRFGLCLSQNMRLTTLFLNKLIHTLSL